ncbi:MAG: hypothetical protein HY709_04420 [Candidatus Latescibacteria bacterium]|nr:hypothetical protein [Candidatus Latescibacterota bacterium]
MGRNKVRKTFTAENIENSGVDRPGGPMVAGREKTEWSIGEEQGTSVEYRGGKNRKERW